MDIWELRRRNLNVLMTLKGHNKSTLAKASNKSINTIGKFLRGESKTMRWDTLDAVCKTLGLDSPAVLDSENPFSDTKNQLYELIRAMSDTEASELLNQARKNRD